MGVVSVRPWSWVAVAVMAMGLVVGVSSGAGAVDEEGLWYFDRFKVQDAHEGGITGKGVTIAVIDSPVNLEVPTLEGADIRVQDAPCVRADGSRLPGVSDSFDEAGHGTAVVSLLVGSGKGFEGQTGVKGLVPDATVLTYAVQYFGDEQECPGMKLRPGQEHYEFDNKSPAAELELAMMQAMDAGADIISVSLAGDAVYGAVARAIREGVIIVAADANADQLDIGGSPSSDNGVVTVNSAGPDGRAATQEYTDVTAPGYDILVQGGRGGWQEQQLVDGTSLATPIVAGNLALAMQKYPDATPNQLLQSLIHNTGAEPHDLEWDPTYGYGVVITDVFLAADPTVYPDVNPFVHNLRDMWPYVDEIWDGAVINHDDSVFDPRPWPIYTPEPQPEPGDSSSPSPQASPSASNTPSADATPAVMAIGGEGGVGWLIPAIVIGAALLLTVAITIAIAVTRTRRR